MNYYLIFLTGLTSGGVTCAALQGGILAGIIANGKTRAGNDKKGLGFDDWGPVSAFLLTKLISHVILGFLLGWLGSRVDLSLSARLFFQGFAAVFMLATALNLLDVHPIFRYLAIQPPKFVYKWLKKTENLSADRHDLSSLFAPAVFGVLTIFIPCGVTQAMEVIAVTSGDPWVGALTMGSFILGTAPVFAVIGLAASRLTEVGKSYFLRAAAVLLIAMSMYSLNGILLVSGSPYSVQKIVTVLRTPAAPSAVDPSVKVENGVQKVTIEIKNGGYVPKRFKVKAGMPVELTLNTSGGVYSCATAFTFKTFDIYEVLGPADKKVHKFTPTEKGQYTFACSMGMYSGIMEVI